MPTAQCKNCKRHFCDSVKFGPSLAKRTFNKFGFCLACQEDPEWQQKRRQEFWARFWLKLGIKTKWYYMYFVEKI